MSAQQIGVVFAHIKVRGTRGWKRYLLLLMALVAGRLVRFPVTAEMRFR